MRLAKLGHVIVAVALAGPLSARAQSSCRALFVSAGSLEAGIPGTLAMEYP